MGLGIYVHQASIVYLLLSSTNEETVEKKKCFPKFLARTCVSPAKVHICDPRPVVGLRVVALDALPDEWAVMATHRVQEAVQNADAGAGATGAHITDRNPNVLIGRRDGKSGKSERKIQVIVIPAHSPAVIRSSSSFYYFCYYI